MKKLLLILLIFPVSMFSQVVQQTSTKVSVNTTNVELAERMPAVINITKPNTMNLDNVKGFVLASCKALMPGMEFVLRPSFKKSMEMTPFEYIHKKNKVKKFGYKEGYIYINYSEKYLNNNNTSSTWIFRDHNRRSVFAFTAINKGVEEILSEIGITSY